MYDDNDRGRKCGERVTEWVISDTHFGHEKIIEYCHRPFKNVEHMDETLIQHWRNIVAPEDIVYHLGDVGITKGDYLEGILDRLPGKKILILGNHDKSAKRMMDMGFDLAVEAMVIRAYNRTLLLTHKPQSVLPQISTEQKIDYVLHGHIHNSRSEHRAIHEHKGELVDIPSFNINMSVEMWNYCPVSLNSVISKKIHKDKHR